MCPHLLAAIFVPSDVPVDASALALWSFSFRLRLKSVFYFTALESIWWKAHRSTPQKQGNRAINRHKWVPPEVIQVNLHHPETEGTKKYDRR